MKKYFTVILSLSLIAITVLTGCGPEKSIDDQFKEAWQEGLSARWKLTTADENKEDIGRDDYKAYVDAELDSISKFKGEEFEDSNLGSLAKSYIAVLEKCNSISSGFDTDKWSKDWSDLSQERYSLIVKLDDIIQPEFDDKDKEQYDALLTEGKVVIAVRDFANKTKFKKVSSSYGWADYEAKVKNDSDINFSYFAYNINLVDKDGVVVETQVATTDNWEPGSTHRFKFSTDAKFKKMEIPTCDYNY